MSRPSEAPETTPQEHRSAKPDTVRESLLRAILCQSCASLPVMLAARI